MSIISSYAGEDESLFEMDWQKYIIETLYKSYAVDNALLT